MGIRQVLGVGGRKCLVHREAADGRVEVPPAMDAMELQVLVERIARNGIVLADQYGEICVVVPVRVALDECNAVDPGQQPTVPGVDIGPARDHLVDVLQLQQAEGSIDLAHLAVDAWRHHGHFIDESEVLEVVDAPLGLRVGADDGAPLECVEHLGGVEAEHGQVAMPQYAALCIAHAKRMGRVVDHLQSIVVGNILDGGNIAGVAVAMHGQDRGGLGRDRCLDLRRIEVQCMRIDVHENGFDAVPEKRMGGGYETVGSRDDLPGDTKGLQRGDQCNRAVRKEGDVLQSQIFLQLEFKFLMAGAIVGQDLPVPDALQVGKKLLQGREVRLRDVNRCFLLPF